MATDTPRGGNRSRIKMGRGQLRLAPGAVKEYNKGNKAGIKAGKAAGPKVSSSGFRAAPKTNSATKPSVKSAAVKGAKNKMKAQGAKAQSAPTARYKQGMRNK